LSKFPQLKAYWTWKSEMEAKYPELVPYFKGTAFKNIDMKSWNQVLVSELNYYAIGGMNLSDGAVSLLKQMWIEAGQPSGTFQAWLDSTIVPSIMNQMQGLYNP
jgi:hypothetical protein